MKSFMRCLVAACLLMFVAFPAFSQSRNTGEIRGTVSDPTGAAISGATVTLTNVDKPIRRCATSSRARAEHAVHEDIRNNRHIFR